jgi:hypothetical protein
MIVARIENIIVIPEVSTRFPVNANVISAKTNVKMAR